MDRIWTFAPGFSARAPLSRRLGSTPIRTRLLLAAWFVIAITPSADAEDLQFVEYELPDFTKMPIEDLVQQDVYVAFVNAPSPRGEDLQYVDEALPDFTNMPLEDLLQQEMSVRERLQATQALTLQEGILGGHVHEAGEWMVGYNYMFMDMDVLRTGTNRVSTADVFADGFTVSPTRMTMEMQMLHLMHAPSDEFTWMVPNTTQAEGRVSYKGGLK